MLDMVVNHPLRDEIFHLLSRYNNDNTIYMLVCLLKQHPDGHVRLSAAGALGDSRSSQAISALLDVLNDVAASRILKEFAFDSVYRLIHKGVTVDHTLYFVRTITVSGTYRAWYATDCLRKVKTPEAEAAIVTLAEKSKQASKPHESQFFP
jgi:HEAT repeat protein